MSPCHWGQCSYPHHSGSSSSSAAEHPATLQGQAELQNLSPDIGEGYMPICAGIRDWRTGDRNQCEWVLWRVIEVRRATMGCVLYDHLFLWTQVSLNEDTKEKFGRSLTASSSLSAGKLRNLLATAEVSFGTKRSSSIGRTIVRPWEGEEMQWTKWAMLRSDTHKQQRD